MVIVPPKGRTIKHHGTVSPGDGEVEGKVKVNVRREKSGRHVPGFVLPRFAEISSHILLSPLKPTRS